MRGGQNNVLLDTPGPTHPLSKVPEKVADSLRGGKHALRVRTATPGSNRPNVLPLQQPGTHRVALTAGRSLEQRDTLSYLPHTPPKKSSKLATPDENQRTRLVDAMPCAGRRTRTMWFGWPKRKVARKERVQGWMGPGLGTILFSLLYSSHTTDSS